MDLQQLQRFMESRNQFNMASTRKRDVDLVDCACHAQTLAQIPRLLVFPVLIDLREQFD